MRLCPEVLDAVQAMTSKNLGINIMMEMMMIITVFVKVMMTTNHIHSKLGDDLGGLKGVELLVPEKIKT